MPVIGECKLCKNTGVELQASHIIPRWAYKRMRDKSASGVNPNPIVISDGRAAQISDQIKEHLLCASCEQILSKNEKYVSSIAYANDGTPVPLNILGAPHRSTSPNDHSLAYLAIDSLETEKIVHFAASVVWRAHVATGNDFKRVILGDKYAEEFRLYLLSQSDFPKNARVSMVILDQPPNSPHPRHNAIAFPTTKKENGYHRHATYLCGLLFEIWVGNKLPQHLNMVCLHHGTQKGAGLFLAEEIGIISTMTKQAKLSIPIGKLK